MQLRIYIKQTVQQDKSGNNIYYQGNTVNTLSPVIGDLPTARQWDSYNNFIDVTGEAGEIDKLNLDWTIQADNEGFIAPGTITPKTSAGGQINFEGAAFRLIKQWLVDDISAQLNSVDVQIAHYDNNNKLCGIFRNWVVKSTDIEWCEDGLCVFDTVFKQQEEKYNCIKSTLISDDWQKWFNDDTDKQHPRFSYCNEIRPNASLIGQWYLMGMAVFMIKTLILPTALALNGLIFAINGIILVINAIIAFINALGANIGPIELIKYINPEDYTEPLGYFYIETAGCGREHPAPLIRDYIKNVCDKCGVSVTAESAPIFFAENMQIETAARGVVNVGNHHYRACYMYTPSLKGIRRFKNVSLFGNNEFDTRYYQSGNSPLKTLDMFLDELSGLYNFAWVIKQGQLFIQRKDFYRLPTKAPVLDLSEYGSDRSRLIEGICYTWNENKIPAYTEGLYTADGIDSAGDEAKTFMNDLLSYGDASRNPVYDGIQDKKVLFGATKFRGDGVSRDYIMDAFQSIVNTNYLSATFGGSTLFGQVQPLLEQYADYALLMRDEKSNLPKVLIWDGGDYYNAKADKYFFGIDTFGAEPPINYNYNSQRYGSNTGWSTAHPPDTYVSGRGLTFGSQTPGLYQVRDIIGTKFYEMKARLINYPMYMGIGYQDTMWDWFHWVDDPNKRSVLLRTAKFKVEACCDLIERLGLFGDGTQTVLGEKVLLPSNTQGTITGIRLIYDSSSERGQHIEITAES